MSVANFLPLTTYREFAPLEMANRARLFRDEMLRRRTVRQFSSRPVSHEVIEDCLSVACSSPSGADKQPWHFVVVSNAEVKSRIRAAAEEEERRFTVDARRKNGSTRWPHSEPTKTSLTLKPRPTSSSSLLSITK
jgi:hypothetical protein